MITFSIMIGGKKSPPHIENDVSRGQQSLIASSNLCAMVPLEKYYSGIFNFGISLTEIASPSRHQCN
jgi:hypothetical protein